MESRSDLPAASSSFNAGSRVGLGKVIPRRPRVTWSLALIFAFVFAVLVTPAITAERWLSSAGVGAVEKDRPAPLTIRIPAFTGRDTADKQLGGGGIVIARGQIATAEDATNVEAIARSTPRGPMPYIAFFMLALIFGVIFAHHMRRSTRGRLVRVQIVSLVTIALIAGLVKTVLLGSAASVLIVPVALLAMVPTMVLDRVVGLATGILAALVVGLLGPFDLGVAILMLVQAATAGLVVAERPRSRWKAALFAGFVSTLFTVATYVLLTYLTTGSMPALGSDMLRSPWVAAAIGPAIAMVLVVPSIPLYQLLVGEITQGKLVELEDLSNPLLQQIAERSPGTWQHSLAMANMAEIAANTIGANGRLVRVGAYYHDLGKSLQPKYFIENLEPGETSPHDRLPPEVSCDAIFAHVTEGIVHARKSGLHERIVDFMHMHHGDGVLEYFWGKVREQGNPRGFTVEDFRYPGHPPQTRETAILAICDAVEAASRTLKSPTPASIDSLVQRIVYGKLHLGQLDESGLSMGDLRRVSDSLRETIRHANHGRIEYPWQKAAQDASASQVVHKPTGETSQLLRLDSLDRRPAPRATGVSPAVSGPIELGASDRKSDREVSASGPKIRVNEANAETTNLKKPDEDLAIVETAPQQPPTGSMSASRQGAWEPSASASGAAAVSAPALDDEFEREAARQIDDPLEELPAGARPGPPPDVIDSSTFARTQTGARKKAATLSPPPPVASPVASGPPRRTLNPSDPPSAPAPHAAGGPTNSYNQTLKPQNDTSAFGQTFRTPEPFADPRTTLPGTQPTRSDADARAAQNLTLRGSDFAPGASGSVAPPSTPTLLGAPVEPALRPSEPRTGAPQNTLVGAPPTVDPASRRRAPTVPSEPPPNAFAKKPSELLAAGRRLGNPSRDTEPNAWTSSNPNPLVPPAGGSARARPVEPSAWAAHLPSEPRRKEPESFVGRVPGLPAEPPASPNIQPPAVVSTLRPDAPARLPADAEAPPPVFPARPSIHPDASSPSLRPSTPTATPTRLGGPPDPVELDNAITNPPPLRRGGSAPPPLAPARDSVAARMPGILLENEAIEHDARVARGDALEDDIRVTAPRVPVPPVTHAGYVSGHDVYDAARTEPSLPRVDLPLRAPPTNPPPSGAEQAQDGSWASGLASRVDAAIDEWGTETPVKPPTKAELRALLGTPDPTKEQSLAEIERLHHAARELPSDPDLLPARNISHTHEVDPDDIEASIEIAPKARTRSPEALAVAKPKKPE